MLLTRTKRGFYAIITTFFFIMVLVSVALGMIFYGTLVLAHQKQANDEMQKYVLAKNVKDRIIFCYGETLIRADRLAADCLQSDLIAGYVIRQTDYNNCVEAEFSFLDPAMSYNDVFTYWTTIFYPTTGQRCLAKLLVYI